MDTQPVRKYRWFWGWNDDKEEAWLHEMALQGLHLEALELPTVYRFRMGEPRNDYYRLDFTPARGKERQQYLQLFADSGWEYIGQLASWQYFRKTAEPGEVPEIFSDNESKIKKYQRLTAVLVVFLPILVLNLNNLNRGQDVFSQVVTFIFFLLTLFYIFAMLMILRRIGQLKKKL